MFTVYVYVTNEIELRRQKLVNIFGNLRPRDIRKYQSNINLCLFERPN